MTILSEQSLASVNLEEGESFLGEDLPFGYLKIILLSIGKVKGRRLHEVGVGVIIEVIRLQSIHQGKEVLFRFDLLYTATDLLILSGSLPYLLHTSNVGDLLLLNLLAQLLNLLYINKTLPAEMQSSVWKTSRFFCWKVKISASS